jgi:hypothetical protein
MAGPDTDSPPRSPRARPQSPQKLAFAALEPPHDGHTTGAGVPHCVQNFLPAGISNAQLVHCIAIAKTFLPAPIRPALRAFSPIARYPGVKRLVSLLCHKREAVFRVDRQHGHRGRRLASAMAITPERGDRQWGAELCGVDERRDGRRVGKRMRTKLKAIKVALGKSMHDPRREDRSLGEADAARASELLRRLG